MILANDFLEYLLNTERDLAVRVRERYDMYPARELLGISQTDERLIYNTVLGRIAEAVR